jgi:hypothetical protein
MLIKKIQIFISFFICAGHFFIFFYKKDFFPFSPYPMYSQLYEPEKMKLYKFHAELISGQKIELRIQKNYPGFWNALFIESIFVDKDILKIKNKMIAFGKQYSDFNKVQIKKIYLVKYEEDWNNFVDSIQNQNFDTNNLTQTIISEHTYE